MADNTPIEWTDATWNPIRARNLATGGVGHFCVHVSEGCRNCYAERLQPRFQNPNRFAAQDRDKVEIYLDENTLTQPLRWKRPRKIFVCSMTDLFGDWVSEATLDRVFAVMAQTPQHTYQIVTKRPERMREYCKYNETAFRVWYRAGEFRDVLYAMGMQGAKWGGESPWPLRNVWLGVSVEDQKTADERIPILLETLAAIRFISAEPLLVSIDLENLRDNTFDALGGLGDRERIEIWDDTPKLDWVIAGGESGPNARPSHPDWFRSLRDQCQSAGVAFLFKQWGEWLPAPWIVDMSSAEFYGLPDYSVHRFDKGCGENEWMRRVGKKAAGRQLDGRTWDEFPF